MKTLKIALTAISLIAASLSAQAASGQAQLESYYRHPNPDNIPSIVYSLSHDGYFDRDENVATSIGFLATVFAQNPDRIQAWMQNFRELPDRQQRLLAAALWQSGDARGQAAVRRLAPSSPVAQDVTQLLNARYVPVAQRPVLTASSLNLQWGAFLASGDKQYVVNILQAAGNNDPVLDRAVAAVIAENAVSHPQVRDICRVQLPQLSVAARTEVRAALQAATPQPVDE